MSVGSQALERSALEAKDRESLVQIAIAMGGKPASRAKKADIIDLVLELAGVGPSSAESGSDAAEDAAAPVAPASTGRGRSARSRADADDEAADADDADDHANEAADTDDADEGNDDEGNEADDDEGDDEPTPGRTVTERVPVQNRGRGERSSGGADRSGRPAEATRSGADEAPSGSEPTGQQNGAGQREDGESGNRRRRRRGRDRDRNRDGQPGQPGPAGQPGQAGAVPAPADDQWQGEPVEVSGLLDLRDEGYGFLRLNGYLPSRDDVYVSVKQVRQFGLRKGDHIKGASRPAARNEKNPALLRIDEINEGDPELNRDRRRFDDLTAVYPDQRLTLETPADPSDMTSRIVDLIAPIGKGQRGLIVSPPKAGTTTILKSIATSIEANDPDVHLMVLLVDERPEEVTAMRRSIQGEVVGSTFDRPAEEHTMVAELALERAKRLVEEGKDVVIVLDGLTRLARAYNLSAPATGRVMAGGIDTGAIYPPKKFFGAARNAEEGGSLTILATVLVETGSTMDEVIFEELTGTADMELRLDRHLAERRTYPAIDVDGSSTGHEELLFGPDELQNVWKLRRVLTELSADGRSGAGLDMLVDRLGSSATNDAFLAEIAAS